MEIACTFRLPRQAATVPVVRTICREAMTRLGISSTCRAEIALALTEACANVIQHAEGVPFYEVRIELRPDYCHIRVLDSGRGLRAAAFTRMPAPDRDAGRGIALMDLLVDRLDVVSRPERGTVVDLEKALELEEDALLRTPD